MPAVHRIQSVCALAAELPRSSLSKSVQALSRSARQLHHSPLSCYVPGCGCAALPLPLQDPHLLGKLDRSCHWACTGVYCARLPQHVPEAHECKQGSLCEDEFVALCTAFCSLSKDRLFEHPFRCPRPASLALAAMHSDATNQARRGSWRLSISDWLCSKALSLL